MSSVRSTTAFAVALCHEILAAGGDPSALRAVVTQLHGNHLPAHWTPATRFAILFHLVCLRDLMVAAPHQGRQWLQQPLPPTRRALLQSLWQTFHQAAPEQAAAYQSWWQALQNQMASGSSLKDRPVV